MTSKHLGILLVISVWASSALQDKRNDKNKWQCKTSSGKGMPPGKRDEFECLDPGNRCTKCQDCTCSKGGKLMKESRIDSASEIHPPPPIGGPCLYKLKLPGPDL